MTRISNRKSIPIADPSLDDYFVGTKRQDGFNTVNFEFQGLLNLFQNYVDITLKLPFLTYQVQVNTLNHINTINQINNIWL
jgi:hypothetical protein